MELCSGGSLFTLLENPANAYGFAEDDFKQVVKDVGKHNVSSGLNLGGSMQVKWLKLLGLCWIPL